MINLASRNNETFSCPRFSELSKRSLNDESVSPVVDEGPVVVHLVLQREVKSEVLDALVVVDLHPRCVLVRLKVLDDVRKPDRKTIVPTHRTEEHDWKLHQAKRR